MPAGQLRPLPEVIRTAEEDGTVKLVLRLADGLEVEAVRIPMGEDKATLCVSSQVGCKLACGFCETGRMGLLRSLSADEIMAQVRVARALGYDVRNIVFMGMGEPLDNVEPLMEALVRLNREMGFGQQRMNVCTAGHVDGLRRLRELGWKRLGISLSLNAASDAKRDRLMPINRRWNLAAVQEAMIAYRPRAKLVYRISYCLLPGLNDEEADADGIAAFVGPLAPALVNVIPYNPGTHPMTRAPEPHEIDRFFGWLRARGVPARVRVTKGRSEMAACGQLGNLELRKRLRVAT
jgi:23S rRNA (adenine2503-C2)-methyltransferase